MKWKYILAVVLVVVCTAAILFAVNTWQQKRAAADGQKPRRVGVIRRRAAKPAPKPRKPEPKNPHPSTARCAPSTAHPCRASS